MPRSFIPCVHASSVNEECSVNSAFVILDGDLHSPAVNEAYNLIETALGKPLDEVRGRIPRPRLNDENLCGHRSDCKFYNKSTERA